MRTFGADLIQSLTEALAHVKGEGRAIAHAPVTPRRSSPGGRRCGRKEKKGGGAMWKRLRDKDLIR